MTDNPNDAMFLIKSDETTFKLFERKQTEHGFKKIHLSFSTIYERWEDLNYDHPLFDFFLSVMVVLSAEFHNRYAIKRKLAKKSRNIPFKTKTVRKYLKETLKKMKKGETEKFKQIESILNDSFTGIKKLLGFPAEDPFEYSYIMTDEVVSEAGNDKECAKYLSDEQYNDEFLTQKQYDRILKEIRVKFPDKAAKIREALFKTRSKEHLSIFSITVEDDVTYVHIVSPEKDQIKFESWKFLLLIEEVGTPLLLHEFKKLSYKDPPEKFIFNNQSEGKVEGRYHPETASLQVIGYKKTPTPPDYNVTFLMDVSYIICLYIILKKLKNDQSKFEVLKEKAESNIANKDVFDNLFSRFTIKLEEKDE